MHSSHPLYEAPALHLRSIATAGGLVAEVVRAAEKLAAARQRAIDILFLADDSYNPPAPGRVTSADLLNATALVAPEALSTTLGLDLVAEHVEKLRGRLRPLVTDEVAEEFRASDVLERRLSLAGVTLGPRPWELRHILALACLDDPSSHIPRLHVPYVEGLATEGEVVEHFRSSTAAAVATDLGPSLRVGPITLTDAPPSSLLRALALRPALEDRFERALPWALLLDAFAIQRLAGGTAPHHDDSDSVLTALRPFLHVCDSGLVYFTDPTVLRALGFQRWVHQGLYEAPWSRPLRAYLSKPSDRNKRAAEGALEAWAEIFEEPAATLDDVVAITATWDTWDAAR